MPTVPSRSDWKITGIGLVRVRSPLLAESLLMSFPPGTEMFQFPGFALPCGSTLAGGFPHSEILGSKLVRSSPRLIAAYHVLHRLSAPRHPPNTLIALDHSHYRCPHVHPNLCHRRIIERPHTFTSFARLSRRLTTTPTGPDPLRNTDPAIEQTFSSRCQINTPQEVQS